MFIGVPGIPMHYFKKQLSIEKRGRGQVKKEKYSVFLMTFLADRQTDFRKRKTSQDQKQATVPCLYPWVKSMF